MAGPIQLYTDPDSRQFVDDMEEAGFDMFHYSGRFWREGPAVRAGNGRDEEPSLQDVMRATDVKLAWEELGLGWVVYPAKPDHYRR